jgi:hypothetical protein
MYEEGNYIYIYIHIIYEDGNYLLYVYICIRKKITYYMSVCVCVCMCVCVCVCVCVYV